MPAQDDRAIRSYLEWSEQRRGTNHATVFDTAQEGTMSSISIRSETPSDVDAVSTVNRAAFEDHPFSEQTEHLIVDALREAGALSVSLVAILDGAVVGHIAFSPAPVGGALTGWYLLGPLAVLPEHQRAGIGSMLVDAGVDRLKAMGARGCVLVGDAAYYRRFGFRTFPELVYAGVPGEYVLGLPLGSEVPVGEIHAHEAFLLDATPGEA
jgi:putative acetyltransferase